MSAEAIEKVVTAYFANMQEMNPEGWIENFAEDAVLYDPVGNPPNLARDTYQKFFGMLSSIFETLELSTDRIFVGGNQAAAKWTMRVVAKNGKPGIAEGISVFEMNESGKIQKVSSYWDDRALMAQLKS